MNTINKSENVIMDTYARHNLTLVRGEGSYVWDDKGNKYLDFTAGISVNNLGHCYPKIVAAIAKQSQSLIHCSNLFWSEPQLALADKLVSGSGLGKIFFSNSGAEANEGAIKLARKYHFDKGQVKKNKIITMNQSFHGRTLATLTATGQDKVKIGFSPLPTGFSYVPFNDYKALLQEVDENTAAIMLEPVQGEGGVFPADAEYLEQVKKLCLDNDILLVFDEIQCGLGRCGTLFCYESYGVVPDIVTLAKALGGGLPMGAFIATDKVAASFGHGSHGSTFGGNPVAAAAGLSYLEGLEQDDILTKVTVMGTYLQEKLKEMNSPQVKAIRGMGLLVGVEITGNSGEVVAEALKKGVILLGAGPHVVRFLPPLNCSKRQIDAAVNALAIILNG